MRAPELIEKLGNEFGRENVLVHSEFHIQVVSGKQKHDVWLTRFGELKWRLKGGRDTSRGSPEKLIDTIKQHNPLRTDLADMQFALALSRSINQAGALAAGHGLTRGVFCDAGFKDGKARGSVVKIDGEYVIANAFPVLADNIADAERQAIGRAMEWYQDDITLLIYSDAKNVVDAMNCTRVKWIPREQNKPADNLANLRRPRE